MSTRARLVNVQVLRAVAALLVVWTHGVDVTSGLRPDGLVARLDGFGDVGSFGVDLFFVISGFVMAHSVVGLSGRADALRFLALRWIRIAPPYLVATALVVAAALWIDGDPLPELPHLANTFLFLPVLDATTFSAPPLFAGWTLSFELAFYGFVAIPVAVGLARRLSLLVAGLVVLTLLGTLLPDGSRYLLVFLTNPILLEFALGIVVYLAWRSRRLATHPRAVHAAGAIGLVVLVALAATDLHGINVAESTFDATRSWQRVLLWGVPAAALMASAVVARTCDVAWLRRLGDASFSIYLIHQVVLRAAATAVDRLDLTVPSTVFLAGSIALGVAAGLVFHRLVEQPLTLKLRGLVFGLRSDSRRALVPTR